MKLLIAHDGSPLSVALIRDLPRCGLPETGEAIVLSVADAWTAVEGDAGPPLAGAVAGTGAELLKAALVKARGTAHAGREAVMPVLPGWSVQAESLAGSPAWEIIRKSDEWRPDLVMLGATGSSRIERLIFGTTSSQVAGHAHASVRICRPSARGGGLRLIVGCDGSAEASDAARQVASRRWPAGTQVRVITAVDGWLVAAIESQKENAGQDPDGAPAEAAALPDTVAPLLRQAGLEVETVARAGDPKRLLIEEATSWEADCIFLGARGRTGLARLVLGSVALATSSRAPCSVEIVRAPR